MSLSVFCYYVYFTLCTTCVLLSSLIYNSASYSIWSSFVCSAANSYCVMRWHQLTGCSTTRFNIMLNLLHLLSSTQIFSLKAHLVDAAGKQGSFIFSCQNDELKMRSAVSNMSLSALPCTKCRFCNRPLSSTLLFLFLTPSSRQRFKDEKCLYTSDCFKKRSHNKALWDQLLAKVQ